MNFSSAPEFHFRLLGDFERSSYKSDNVLLNEIATKINSRPEEFYEDASSPEQNVWTCTLRWSNLGPFKGTGRNKKEAKAEACRLAMDAIEERHQYYVDLVKSGIKQVPQNSSRLPPFSSRVPENLLQYLKETKTTGHVSNEKGTEQQRANTSAVAEVNLESDLSVFVVEKPSYIFMIDLDNSTHMLNGLIQDCKRYRLRGVLLEGYAGRVYENPNLPVIVKIIKTPSSVKNAADFMMAYRAAIRACEYRDSTEKPTIVIISKDLGLEAIVVMLKKELFDAYHCCSADETRNLFETWKQQSSDTEQAQPTKREDYLSM
ncbi:hypothetical protein GpartN1_g1735.t1 [Galdieria partita]|uniref:DRBM domain-containing protein n=1 Tax=Galdieria partita TaxID=83374 RepID=A0A9C7PT76_9RHOD|nr:hypothetical protein GpartN1_g1735.t1 [Galdieria partita]